MQVNNSKKLIINSTFTFTVIGIVLALIVESKIYFNSHLKKLTQSLPSNLATYKVKYFEEKQIPGHDISGNHKLSIYDRTPMKVIHKLTNVHAIESQMAEEELPNEIEKDIVEDPLFKGYYIQLGIFNEKNAAQNSIQNLVDRAIIDAKFRGYIETKYIQEKQFYLAQIGVFESKNDAVTFCDSLQKIGIGCLIID